MEARALTRPATTLANLLLRGQQTPATLSALVPRRGHKTFSRTKRALNIPPHPDFLPSSSSSSSSSTPTTGAGSGEVVLFNPPSAAPSVFHTPFKFLPSTDPRRRANLSSFFANNNSSTTSSSSPSSSSRPLPPALNVPARGANPRYHLTREDVAEIRRLRAEDPVRWSVSALARKFDCSETFITICTPAPREHKERLARNLEAVKARWGSIRTKARQDRARRKEMLFRGEL